MAAGSRLATIEAMLCQEIDRVHGTLSGSLRHEAEIKNKTSPNGWLEMMEAYPDMAQFADLRTLHSILSEVRHLQNRRSSTGRGLPRFAKVRPEPGVPQR